VPARGSQGSQAWTDWAGDNPKRLRSGGKEVKIPQSGNGRLWKLTVQDCKGF